MDESQKTSTAERLTQIMDERGLKQVDILEACKPFCMKFNMKLNKNDLSQYVSGKVVPSQKKLTILALALDVNECWLMGYDVPPGREELHTLELNLQKEVESCELFESKYGREALEVVSMFLQLDPTDRSTIKDFIAVLLKKDKYHSSG